MVRWVGVAAVGLVVALGLAATASPLPVLDLPTVLDPGGSRFVAVDPVHAAWSIDLGLSLAAGNGVATPHAKEKSVCPLGDVDGDGNDDLLVRLAPGKSEDKAKFEALAGPDFTRSLWRAAPSDHRLMHCGVDLTGDGVTDPITVGEPVPTDSPLPQTGNDDSSVTTTVPVDGAAGESLAQIPVDSSLQAIEAGPFEASTSQGGAVVPAGEGALLVIGATETGTSAGLPQDISAGTSQATVQVVDGSGTPLGTIETPPLADALAAAPVPTGDGGLPAVVLLTETEVVPIDQVPVGVPTVAVYEGDGTATWTQDQAPTTGVPVVLPDAGDVDGDGTPDVIYATVPADVATAPAGGFVVLSGDDGLPLLDSGPAQDGLVTALPLGEVTGDGADEILVIEQPTDGSPITLTAESGDGQVAWSTQIDAAAEPANTVVDAGSGNTLGFSDVTGDGAPDIVVTSPSGDGITVEVIDGTTGETVWEDTFGGADAVETVPSGDGQGSDLVIVDTDDGLEVTNVDGSTGQPTWSTTGPGMTTQAVAITDAGDVDGDGTPDVLVTVGEAGPDGEPDPDQPGSSYILSGETGETLWSGSTDGSEDGIVGLDQDAAENEVEASGKPWLWLVLGAALIVGAVALVVLKRRKSAGP